MQLTALLVLTVIMNYAKCMNCGKKWDSLISFLKSQCNKEMTKKELYPIPPTNNCPSQLFYIYIHNKGCHSGVIVCPYEFYHPEKESVETPSFNANQSEEITKKAPSIPI